MEKKAAETKGNPFDFRFAFYFPVWDRLWLWTDLSVHSEAEWFTIAQWSATCAHQQWKNKEIKHEMKIYSKLKYAFRLPRVLFVAISNYLQSILNHVWREANGKCWTSVQMLRNENEGKLTQFNGHFCGICVIHFPVNLFVLIYPVAVRTASMDGPSDAADSKWKCVRIVSSGLPTRNFIN